MGKSESNSDELSRLRQEVQELQAERTKYVSMVNRMTDVNKVLRERLSLAMNFEQKMRTATDLYRAQLRQQVETAQAVQNLLQMTEERVPESEELDKLVQACISLENEPKIIVVSNADDPPAVVAKVGTPPPVRYKRSASISQPVTLVPESVDAKRSPSQFEAEGMNKSHLEQLCLFSIFQGLPEVVMDDVESAVYEVRRKAGHNIVKKGDVADEVFLIVEGKVSILDDDGNEISALESGQTLGIVGLLLGEKRVTTLVAKTEVWLLVITRQRLLAIAEKHSEFKSKINVETKQMKEWWSNLKAQPNLKDFGGEFAADLVRRDLKKLEMLGDIAETTIDKLAMKMLMLVVEAGNLVIRKDDVADCMYFILRGSVQVLGVEDVVHAEMHNGHFFGEVGILLDMKRTASIKAKTTCHLFKLTKDSVLDCCKQSSELQAKFKAAADERYALYEKRMATQNDTQTGSKPENKIEQFDLEVTEQNLRKLQIFRNVEDCTLKELALLMERSDIETGQIIIQCGETAESMYFLASGRVVIISEFGDELDTADGPYAWFGEVAILEQVPRTATVKAISKCSVFELKRGSLLELLEKDPTIAEQLRESSLSRLQKYLMRNVLA